eukprot:4264581-Pyramimonas_sp.AAC.1
MATDDYESDSKTANVCQDDSNSTKRFADLARLADRVQPSGFNRRMRLIILNRLAGLTSSVAALQLELS